MRGGAPTPPRRLQRFAHRVDWWLAIKPDGKRKRTLVEQHRYSIGTARAGLFGRAQQSGFRRPVYAIENHVMRSDQAAWDWRRIAWIHSKRSGIDDEIDVRKLHAHYRFFPRYGFKARRGT